MGEGSLENKESVLEAPSCLVCGEHKNRLAYSWPKSLPHEVVRCVRCGFHYLSPRPQESAMLEVYRDEAYYREGAGPGYAGYETQERSLRRTFARFMQNLEKRGLTGGRLLEVGCGFGYLLQEAAPFFEEREGTDFSQAAVDRASRAADRVYLGGCEVLPPGRRYDCIVANHVIEHVYRPEPFLKELTGRLRSGGHLVVTTPDMGSFWRRCMGKRWPSFKIPEHVAYYDGRSLASLMTRAGLSEPRPLPFPHAFPLSLVAAKLGISFRGALGSINLWLPKTTLALWSRSNP